MKHVLSICLNIRSQTQCEINSHSPGITLDGRKGTFRPTKHGETRRLAAPQRWRLQSRNNQISTALLQRSYGRLVMLVSIQTLFFLADQISPLQVFCSSLQVFTFLYSSLYFSSVLFSYLHCFKVLCSSLEYSIVLYSSLEYNIVIYNSLQIPTVNLHFPAVLPAVLSGLNQFLQLPVSLCSCLSVLLSIFVPGDHNPTHHLHSETN